MDLENEKSFQNIWQLLEEHECQDWEEFREFVHYATDDYADIGYIGGDCSVDNGGFEDSEEMSGIFFLTEEGVGKILYFPFTLDEFTKEIEDMQIFED